MRDEKLTALVALQPEGRVNAEARLLAGEVRFLHCNVRFLVRTPLPFPTLYSAFSLSSPLFIGKSFG